MTAERLLFPAVLAACAALTLLSAAEAARVAQARADAQIATAPVVHLERVTITATREMPRSHLASASSTDASQTATR